jgi:hypothetical protein
MPRDEGDPPGAVLAEFVCDGDCSSGAKEIPIVYFDANGVEVPDARECEQCGDHVFYGERHDCDGI